MGKLRILIVEDEAVTAADLHDELTTQGYEIVGTADTAVGALRLADERQPDLVLMDINLASPPGGILAASALRGGSIPVIFLTAHYDAATLDRAKQTSPVGFITKPFQADQLGVAIEIGIARHRSDLERLRLARELAEERAEVKILRGLLPICSCCHKIRDADGKWRTLARYLTDHSEATLTHSYCLECAAAAIEQPNEIPKPRAG